MQLDTFEIVFEEATWEEEDAARQEHGRELPGFMVLKWGNVTLRRKPLYDVYLPHSSVHNRECPLDQHMVAEWIMELFKLNPEE